MFASFNKNVLGIPENETIYSTIKKYGFVSTFTGFVAVSLAMFHIITSYVGQLEAFRHRATHLLVLLILIYLSSIEKRVHTDVKHKKLFNAIDGLLVILAVFSFFYTFINSPLIPLRAGMPSVLDKVVGTIIIVLSIEGARRHVGKGIVVITVFFLFYVYAGPIFPGFLGHAPFTFGEIVNIQYLDLEGLWGAPLGAAASFVIIFLLFAGLMMETGILDTFMSVSLKLFGKSVGGPAKVAVASSMAAGMITGAAVSNTLLTGQITIPLMKKMGYKPHFAAAVEAAASTGGQVMPPIMGSTAFIIAMFLGVPYLAVCKAAFFPAIFWFLSIYIIVHLEAKKLKLQPLTDEDMALLPKWKFLLERSFLVIPIIILVVVLVMGYSAVKAGFYGIVSLLLISIIKKEYRFTLSGLLHGLRAGVETAFSVTTACACAGIIVGCIMQSGLGYTLSNSLIRIASGRVFILLPLVAFVSIILGTGMMTVGVYIIVSALVVPAMVSLGLNVMGCHLFAFYFGILCNVTPPVATAAYAAAGLANTSPWRTGLTAFKLCLPIFCIPFIFITQPALMMEGSILQILITVLSSLAGIFCFDIVVSGFLVRECSVFEKVLFFVAGVLLILHSITFVLIGAAIFLIAYFMQKKILPKETAIA